MVENTSEKKKVFDEYRRAGDVPSGGFDKDQIKTHQKAKKILEIIEIAEKDVRKKASRIFDEFNVSFEYTSSDNSKMSQKIVNSIAFTKSGDANKQDLHVSINFNFSNLGQFPPEEVYMAVYALMYDTLLKKKDMTAGNHEYKFDKGNENGPAVNDAHVDRSGNYVRPTIFEYVKKILKLLLSDDLEPERIQGLIDQSGCAQEISNNLISAGISPADMFENPKGQNLLAERYGKIVKQGYMQQATSLLGEISKEEFESLKTNNVGQIQSFCEKYARIILSNSGINANDVQITFNAQGDIGTYLDYGNKQEVNINIREIMKLKNPAEVVMTLSHELGHAIDSTKNKSEGKTTKEGYGLLNNLVGDVHSDIDKVEGEEKEVRDLLLKINLVCYRVNPNERSARISELAAIKFMQGMHPDKAMQKYIAESIESYKNYQKSVIESMQQIEELRANYQKIKPIIKNSLTLRIFDERFSYLESLKAKGMLDAEQEREAIRIAMDSKDKIAQGEGLQENPKQLGDV